MVMVIYQKAKFHAYGFDHISLQLIYSYLYLIVTGLV